ncbi:MAG: hypothetical protein GXP55_19580 [Deltaproteobacteria bacterium]|nr:hypothetical protein [Deltaproteobacteria bacterium]
MRVAIIGHTEWVTFARVPHAPAAGEIVHASESWEELAGGGGVAAAELARLAHAHGDSVMFFSAIGDDEVGARVRSSLEARALDLQLATRRAPHPRAVTLLDDDSERTITVLAPPLGCRGSDALDWSALDACDALYFCKGDAAALREARRARVLVATARVLDVIREAGVFVDVLVRSAHDASELYAPGDLAPPPALVVSTEGAAGGSTITSTGEHGRWVAAPAPASIADTYGAGDTFAAALTYALAAGCDLREALLFAGERGALALGRRGAGR